MYHGLWDGYISNQHCFHKFEYYYIFFLSSLAVEYLCNLLWCWLPIMHFWPFSLYYILDVWYVAPLDTMPHFDRYPNSKQQTLKISRPLVTVTSRSSSPTLSEKNVTTKRSLFEKIGSLNFFIIWIGNLLILGVLVSLRNYPDLLRYMGSSRSRIREDHLLWKKLTSSILRSFCG